MKKQTNTTLAVVGIIVLVIAVAIVYRLMNLKPLPPIAEPTPIASEPLPFYPCNPELEKCS